ncbi:MAG: hypothetical protein K1X94_35475 [Sandaracinaceae bacterium]|nr:hypothetical protein [Sandaracinaceae bacterium]
MRIAWEGRSATELARRIGERAGLVLDARDLARAPSRDDWQLLTTAGLRGVLVALEDATAPGHELVHGPGGHAAALGALRDARACGLALAALTVVTRSSARSCAAVAELLLEHRVEAWCLTLARAADPAEAARVLPSLGVTVPHVLRAADRAARGGCTVVLRGFPRCLLGPYARWQPSETAEAPHTAPPCADCASRASCPGLSPLHRARFGSRELRAGPTVAEDRDPGRLSRVSWWIDALKTSAE